MKIIVADIVRENSHANYSVGGVDVIVLARYKNKKINNYYAYAKSFIYEPVYEYKRVVSSDSIKLKAKSLSEAIEESKTLTYKDDLSGTKILSDFDIKMWLEGDA